MKVHGSTCISCGTYVLVVSSFVMPSSPLSVVCFQHTVSSSIYAMFVRFIRAAESHWWCHMLFRWRMLQM